MPVEDVEGCGAKSGRAGRGPALFSLGAGIEERWEAFAASSISFQGVRDSKAHRWRVGLGGSVGCKVLPPDWVACPFSVVPAWTNALRTGSPR